MKLRLFHILVISTVALLSLLAFQLWKTVRPYRSLVPLVAELAPGVTQRAREFRRSQVKNGRTLWEVSATDVQYSQEKNEASIRDVTLKWYLDKGQTVGIQGESGRLRLAGTQVEEVEVSGHVEFSLGSYQLQIPSASYQRASEKIAAPGPVKLTGDGLELTGSKLEVDLRASTLLLEGDVRMVLRPDTLGKELPHAPL